MLGGLWLTGAYAATPADEVNSLVEAGHMAQADTYCLKHEEAFGEPVFNLFLGVAALDTVTRAKG